MRVHASPGVSAAILADGSLVLTSELTGSNYQYSSVNAAMWIALRQHGGDCDAAANMLAVVWGADPVNARADMEMWAEELCDAGLVHIGC
ncbi:hypothetical protein DFR70_101926 [Nocardia tenerifensis]|uniref:Coenzyme PQQ synthesis protein D (PqqD) n=1 Tax=Nocardia tenerifensis TaxID=228006 RepID=A0A318KGV3_9NOCA|nr:hypothetical protein [Nocardia tenerifensis]PXX71492.1 hypothetical protein DFR70_101926 [Nocardia tenerifensis]